MFTFVMTFCAPFILSLQFLDNFDPNGFLFAKALPVGIFHFFKFLRKNVILWHYLHGEVSRWYKVNITRIIWNTDDQPNMNILPLINVSIHTQKLCFGGV